MDTRAFVIACIVSCTFLWAGCATPSSGQLTNSRVLAPDQDDDIGGSFVESADIRTVASRMCPAILSVPEIAESPEVVRIAMSPVRNSTRHVFDKDIFLRRLRVELNRYSEGRVRFIDEKAAGETSYRVARERDENEWESLMENAAQAVVDSPAVRDSSTPVRVAVMQVRNVNMIDMNADSFAALLRAKIAERAAGRVVFLTARPETDPFDPASYPEADYYLTGDFIAGSVKGEQLDTTTVYMVSSDTVSMNTASASGAGGPAGAANQMQASAVVGRSTSLTPIAEWKDSPNLTKYFNVMLVKPGTQEAVLEKLIEVESKVQSGLGRANLILTGDISALSKAGGGDVSDYVLMAFQLIDPDTNEVIWEDAYETKRVTSKSVLYK